MENADYMATHKDYSESVDALERAIAVLKKQAYDRSQAELMQVHFFACCGYGAYDHLQSGERCCAVSKMSGQTSFGSVPA